MSASKKPASSETAAAYARAESHADKIINIAARPEKALRDRKSVGIVLDSHRKFQRDLQLAPHRCPGPTREVAGRVYDFSAIAINPSCGCQSDCSGRVSEAA